MDGDDLGKWRWRQKQPAVWAQLLPEQWVEREDADRPVPRGHAEEIAIDGETEPVVVKLGV